MASPHVSAVWNISPASVAEFWPRRRENPDRKRPSQQMLRLKILRDIRRSEENWNAKKRTQKLSHLVDGQWIYPRIWIWRDHHSRKARGHLRNWQPAINPKQQPLRSSSKNNFNDKRIEAWERGGTKMKLGEKYKMHDEDLFLQIKWMG